MKIEENPRKSMSIYENLGKFFENLKIDNENLRKSTRIYEKPTRIYEDLRESMKIYENIENV